REAGRDLGERDLVSIQLLLEPLYLVYIAFVAPVGHMRIPRRWWARIYPSTTDRSALHRTQHQPSDQIATQYEEQDDGGNGYDERPRRVEPPLGHHRALE